uniref:F-box domain-containing protein n=1 Tax=Pristionchus pacificus TaxID=54126 RepID=A0A2A6CY75_PRIPA
AMVSNILELPHEMICKVVKHVDLKGQLALRKVCRTTKEIVDEAAFKVSFVQKIDFRLSIVSIWLSLKLKEKEMIRN